VKTVYSVQNLAIDVLGNEELGGANGLMMASKLVGIGGGAAGLALIMQRWGLRAAVLVQFLLLISIMLLPLLVLERPGDRLVPWGRRGGISRAPSVTIISPLKVLHDLGRAFRVRTVVTIALFGCMSAVSEWLVEVINKPFYTKVLGWTFVKFSAVSGLLLILQTAAALAGGWAANRMGWRSTLALGLGAYGLLALAFGTLNPVLIRTWFPVAFLFLPPAANAFGSVAFYSVAMRVSWTRSAATVFTSMMATTSLGHVIGGWMIGPLRDGLGLSYQGVYTLGGALMLVSLLFLLTADADKVDQLKRFEAQGAVV
jgi:PAT family beta-lactamase induction signal transducer AmpG